MSAEVTLVDVEARPTVVVARSTTWAEFPRLWKVLLDEVWACVRANGISSGCPNVMLYLDGVPNVEVGVELRQPIELSGSVVRSSLPAGRIARTVHRGSFAGVGSSHEAIGAWCRSEGHRPAGPRWEIYGPHDDDPTKLWVEVSWLLEAS